MPKVYCIKSGSGNYLAEMGRSYYWTSSITNARLYQFLTAATTVKGIIQPSYSEDIKIVELTITEKEI